MKRIVLFSLLLTSALSFFSCDDKDDKMDKGGGGNYQFSASFLKADLTGASSLVLAAGKNATRGSITKGEGDGHGNDNEQHISFDYSTPLYKVSADGSMVEVGYDIEVTTTGKTDGESYEYKDSLQANLRLSIEYIYGINDKWLMLYNCNYDYPGYDDLPDGNFKNALRRLMEQDSNRDRNYMVRLEDGALFLLEKGGHTPGLGRAQTHTQAESVGAMEMIGNDIYYLDQGPRLLRMEDRGSSLNVVQILSNNIYNDYILSNGSVLGVVPKFETSGRETQIGKPSIVFPGQNSTVQVSGIGLDDRDVELFMVDNEFYVSRNNGDTINEIAYPKGNAYLIIGENEYQMNVMEDNSKYSVYNVPVPAGSKIYFKKENGEKVVLCTNANNDFNDVENAFKGVLCDENEPDVKQWGYYVPVTVAEAGNYEFYVNSDYMLYAPEGWSKDELPSATITYHYDRYERGDEAAVYKVEISSNTASLSEEPVLRYIGSRPRFTRNGRNGQQGESDYDTRHRRIITGGILSWIDELADYYAVVNRIDFTTRTYSKMELTGHFPYDISKYYDGTAYVADGNRGYYVCSLADGVESYVPFDLSALSQYSEGMATSPSEAVFMPEIMEFRMTAFMNDGTQLDFYVDIQGNEAGKARVFATEGSGSGMVISSLVRLN